MSNQKEEKQQSSTNPPVHDMAIMQANIFALIEAQAQILSLLKKTDLDDERRKIHESSSAFLTSILKKGEEQSNR